MPSALIPLPDTQDLASLAACSCAEMEAVIVEGSQGVQLPLTDLDALVSHQQELKSALGLLVNLVELSSSTARRLAVVRYDGSSFVGPSGGCQGSASQASVPMPSQPEVPSCLHPGERTSGDPPSRLVFKPHFFTV